MGLTTYLLKNWQNNITITNDNDIKKAVDEKSIHNVFEWFNTGFNSNGMPTPTLPLIKIVEVATWCYNRGDSLLLLPGEMIEKEINTNSEKFSIPQEVIRTLLGKISLLKNK